MLASCDGLLNAGLEHLKGMNVRVRSRAAPGRVARKSPEPYSRVIRRGGRSHSSCRAAPPW